MSSTLTRQQKYERLKELFRTASDRYLFLDGNPHKAVDCKLHLNEEEQQEFLDIARELSEKSV